MCLRFTDELMFYRQVTCECVSFHLVPLCKHTEELTKMKHTLGKLQSSLVGTLLETCAIISAQLSKIHKKCIIIFIHFNASVLHATHLS